MNNIISTLNSLLEDYPCRLSATTFALTVRVEAVFCIRNLRTHPAVGRVIYNLEFTQRLADNLWLCAEIFEPLLRMLPEIYSSSLIFSLTICHLSAFFRSVQAWRLTLYTAATDYGKRGCVCYMRLHSCSINYGFWNNINNELDATVTVY